MNLPEIITFDSLDLGVCSVNWTSEQVREFNDCVMIRESGRVVFFVDEERLSAGRHPAREGNYGLGDMAGAYIARIEEYNERSKGVRVGEY